jgi:hypothetical protein
VTGFPVAEGLGRLLVIVVVVLTGLTTSVTLSVAVVASEVFAGLNVTVRV